MAINRSRNEFGLIVGNTNEITVKKNQTNIVKLRFKYKSILQKKNQLEMLIDDILNKIHAKN